MKGVASVTAVIRIARDMREASIAESLHNLGSDLQIALHVKPTSPLGLPQSQPLHPTLLSTRD
jgi:hypothetical protein